jgi:hypothetical protein
MQKEHNSDYQKLTSGDKKRIQRPKYQVHYEWATEETENENQTEEHHSDEEEK